MTELQSAADTFDKFRNTPEMPFQKMMMDFCSHIGKKEQERFKLVTYADVRETYNHIEMDRPGQKTFKFGRFVRFLAAMREFESTLEVIVNASSFMYLIWGPVKFCLQVRDLR